MTVFTFSCSLRAITFMMGTPLVLRDMSGRSSKALIDSTLPLFVKKRSWSWVSTTMMWRTGSSSLMIMLETPLPPRC